MAAGTIDYDLHGLVGVRLEGAGHAEAAAVDRQLGGMRGALAREPDVRVRFVDRLDLEGPLRLLGTGDAGFAGDAFVLLRGPRKSRARVGIAMDRIGAGGGFVAERGLRGVPLLIAAVNLAALGRGVLPLHASAFEHRGAGVLATGWSKGGKTEAMLAFMAHGARFVGDEWVHVAPDGRLHGLAEPVTLWDWHLAQLPAIGARVGARDRARLRVLRAAAAAAARPRRGGRLAALLERQLHVDAAPARLFGAGRLAPAGTPDRVFLMRSWAAPEVRVTPVDGGAVAAAMAFSLQYERAPLLASYQQFRFAFPDRANPLIEDAPRRERALLDRLLAGRAAHAVDHPYPVRLEALFDAMAPYC